MILLGRKTEDGSGVELLIPIAIMIHWIRNPKEKQWKQAMINLIMALVVGLAMLPKTLAFLDETIRAKLNPNPSRSGA